MEKKLQFRHYLYVGSMLFGLFFGAGNLIFPVHMGQEAGQNVFSANLGFLVTGIGLPFLGVIAIGISQQNGILEVASRVGKKYGMIFTILLYLTIGPFFALPRLATTSFEIGIAPMIPKSSHTLVLALFSILFFFFAWFYSRKPSRLLDYIGKVLNPLFLVLLGVLVLLAFWHPLGDWQTSAVQSAYQSSSFFKGLTEGYNTLDALASLAFGIIIVSTLKTMGVTQPRTIAADTIKSGAISILLMGIIYTCLSFMGAMSLGNFAMSENGGIALAQIASYYLGRGGMILLAFVVIIACLKTAIGLISAFSETFHMMFPNVSYLAFTLIASALPCLFANVGLTNIIKFSLPVLMFLYPLAITLILLVLTSRLFHDHRAVYQWVTILTAIAALFDALKSAPPFLSNSAFGQRMIDFATEWLPLYPLGFGWIFPALIGLALGLIISFARSEQRK
ncbi:branched-chain amino acid transport system II carrier protein [Enterococcus hirae]|jgi:LIVCS family branched-chain amino acid:cation transporter|nr:branched-chain amino acid transport system II carrier protein [Enterococcaceae bacterium]MCI1919850.1 branched-chain amino acid transport system II carrier protein [Enterococcaceae bacterium]MDM8212656.1 branched-chain amino acid transport system II carrier protein [Enterococcus hirae]